MARSVDDGHLHVDLKYEHVVRNQINARRINEAIEDGRITRDEDVSFICECGQLGCNAVIPLSLAAYECVRANPRQFLATVDHGARFDRLISWPTGYAIVIRDGRAGATAERTDPRHGE